MRIINSLYAGTTLVRAPLKSGPLVHVHVPEAKKSHQNPLGVGHQWRASSYESTRIWTWSVGNLCINVAVRVARAALTTSRLPGLEAQQAWTQCEPSLPVGQPSS